MCKSIRRLFLDFFNCSLLTALRAYNVWSGFRSRDLEILLCSERRIHYYGNNNNELALNSEQIQENYKLPEAEVEQLKIYNGKCEAAVAYWLQLVS